MMETQSDGNLDSIARMKNLQARMESQHNTHLDLLASLQTQVPNIVSSLDLSLKVVSSFNNRPFIPTPSLPNPNKISNHPIKPTKPISVPTTKAQNAATTSSNSNPVGKSESNEILDESGNSSTVLRKLENDQNATAAEKAALRELGGDSGAILAVEVALRSIAEDNGGVELETFEVSGKSRIMVLGIDRTRLMRELPESKQFQEKSLSLSDGNGNGNVNVNGGSGGGGGGGVFGGGGHVQRAMPPDMWMGGPGGEQHMGGFPMGGMMRPRGVRGMGMIGMGRGVGVHPMHRPAAAAALAPQIGGGGGVNAMLQKPRTEEDDMKDLEALLKKKSFMELQKSKTGEELLDLIHRPTARETAVAEKFKTIGGPNLKEYCTSLTKEDCRRQTGSFMACEKVHFRRIIAPHTDINLGDCSFLDTCRHMKTCKYVHYEIDQMPDVLPPPKPLKRAEYCSEVELDPPWDIHMELPYGTMADDEMRNLNVPALQTHGLIFLWVTGRAMELGRECLELWGYKRIEEIIWVKTNQLQRIIRTGRTGHWLNHSKEHCLVGIKGSPEVNRNIDTDVIVAEVRETSRKPDEMYPMLERISPRTRKLELFARMHNTHAGWMSLGNQLNGVRLVDEGLRARFKAAYPDVEVQPHSPPRASAMEVDSGPAAQMRNPFATAESKSTSTQFTEHAA
uniref:N6-adenosine-methyltransferase MT-A70-like n=1 Tax=Fagus sylvatica TaxID=28930 RepID=A0A2N9FZV4_FAGSY